MTPILASQYASSEVPGTLLSCAVGALLHRRLASNESSTVRRIAITWAASFVVLSGAVLIYAHGIGSFSELVGPLAIASAMAPTLISEKARHYNRLTKRIPPVVVLTLVAVLSLAAGIVYHQLSIGYRVEDFYHIRRAVTLWILGTSIAIALVVPSRHFLPYSVIGLLNTYSKYGGDVGFWGWPGSGAMTEPYHSIVTHLGPFVLLGICLETLTDPNGEKEKAA